MEPGLRLGLELKPEHKHNHHHENKRELVNKHQLELESDLAR